MMTHEQFLEGLEKYFPDSDKGTKRFLWQQYQEDPVGKPKVLLGLHWVPTYIRPLDDEEKQAATQREEANRA